MVDWVAPPEPDPPLCRLGFHTWSPWEWGRWVRYGSNSYQRRCTRDCGTFQQKSMRWLMAHPDEKVLITPVEDDD